MQGGVLKKVWAGGPDKNCWNIPNVAFKGDKKYGWGVFAKRKHTWGDGGSVK